MNEFPNNSWKWNLCSIQSAVWTVTLQNHVALKTRNARLDNCHMPTHNFWIHLIYESWLWIFHISLLRRKTKFVHSFTFKFLSRAELIASALILIKDSIHSMQQQPSDFPHSMTEKCSTTDPHNFSIVMAAHELCVSEWRLVFFLPGNGRHSTWQPPACRLHRI